MIKNNMQTNLGTTKLVLITSKKILDTFSNKFDTTLNYTQKKKAKKDVQRAIL